MYGPPVDLSFKELSNLSDAWTETPTSSLRPAKKNSELKYPSCALRLNNNNITDLHDLQKTITHFLAEPSLLAWLDLSFNKLSHVDEDLCELSELRVLYLHGNDIFIQSEVDRLGVLPHLHTITLHGNLIENNKAYRPVFCGRKDADHKRPAVIYNYSQLLARTKKNRVIAALPRLKSMDFSAVTRQERVLAKIWHHCSNRGSNKGSFH